LQLVRDLHIIQVGASENIPRALSSSIYFLWKDEEKRKILEREINKVLPEEFDLANLDEK